MEARTDLKVYEAGCKKLENFQVLAQGGVERRTGTKFIAETNTGQGTAGDNPVQLVPFDFSIDASYVIEIGTGGYINVYTQTSSTPVAVSAASGHTIPNYAVADLGSIQFVRRFDTVILTHPNYPPQVLQRTVVEPNLAFEIKELEYDYPPLLEKNTTNITLDPSAATGNITLQASASLFREGDVGSTWAINETRTSSQISIPLDTWTSDPSGGANDYISGELDVAFVNFQVTTDNQSNASGTMIIQRSTDGGATFENFALLGVVASGSNFTFSSSRPMGSNTKIRIFLNTNDQSKFGGTLATDNLEIKGLVKITNFTDDQNVDATVISTLANDDPTTNWSESAFSKFRGFTRTASFYENRLWFTGSFVEPSTVFASASGDYFNFLLDPLADASIKRIVDSSEDARWLQGKRYLFMGTTGTTVSIRSADRDSLITLNNVQTKNENTYGSADIQAELANDVVVYAQSDKRKLRALYYNNDEDIYRSTNLNTGNDEILNSTVKEMFLQKQPYQIIWCILEDGNMASLTYEREEEVTGWSLMSTTDGKFISGCSVPGVSEDFVWVCVERNGKYLIEQFQPKQNLDWYVDSGVKINSGEAANASLDVEDSKVKITKTNHNMNGKYIKINSSIDQFNNVYYVDEIDANNFYLKNITDTSKFITYIPTGNEVESNLPPTIIAQGNVVFYQSVTTRDDGTPIPSFHYLNYPIEAISSNVWASGVSFSVGDTIFPDTNYNQVWQCSEAHTSSGTFPDYSKFGGSPIWSYNDLNDETIEWNEFTLPHQRQWIRYDTYDGSIEGFIATSTSPFQNQYFVPNNGWTLNNPIVTRDPNITDNITYNEVFNQVTGLDRINGEKVQIVGDGNFVKEVTVGGADSGGVANEITLTDYFQTILVGLPYDSILQPLPIQPSIRFSSSQGTVKAITKSIVRFYKSLGGLVGEAGQRLTSIDALSTTDKAGEILEVTTGEQRFLHASDWDRNKIIEIKQNLPYSMTVLSLMTDVSMEGM